MINTDRIVSVTKTDLVTLYGTILKIANVSVTAINAKNNEGDFVIASASGNSIASEPLRSLEITAGTSAVVYFVPTYDFKGFTIAGTPVTTSGADVDADGVTLYTATLSGGNAIAVAKVGF